MKTERERLGMTQPQFADAAGAKKRTLIDWEKGVSSPTAVQLAALIEIGVDALYVLTGERSANLEPQALLPEGDRILLDNFHAAPVQVQAGVKTALGAFSSATGKVKSRKSAA